MGDESFLSMMLTSGGDKRIVVRNGSNTNIYGASPHPRATLGYASSTANDISMAAFAHLSAMMSVLPAGAISDRAFYSQALERLRLRIRQIWQLPIGVDVVFAPSGTDLELAALAMVKARSNLPVTNILLGQDEVGSGCVLAAAGRFFADETAVEPRVIKGSQVDGLGSTELVNIAIRDELGCAYASIDIAAKLIAAGNDCVASGRHLLVHVVHGSKTGLVVPNLSDLDRLRHHFGASMSVVVDACQARIEGVTIQAYLDRGAMVMLSGSKFIGGPPFSGLLLVPPAMEPKTELASGVKMVSRRAEWPTHWRCADHLSDSANPGLLLRLQAALFELERYTSLSDRQRNGVMESFGRAVACLSDRLGASVIAPALSGTALQQSTLATLDLSACPGTPDLATAQRWCRVLAARGLRLGQPVKCRKLANGEWAGTLRISLSMPLIVELSMLSPDRLHQRLDDDMAQISDVLEAAFSNRRPAMAV